MNQFSIILNLIKYILEYFRDIIQTGKPLHSCCYKKDKNYAFGMVINSKKLVNFLISIGCGPRKTFNLKWPQINIKEDLINHFIRGLFDGDGCIYAKPEKLKRCSISLVGNKPSSG